MAEPYTTGGHTGREDMSPPSSKSRITMWVVLTLLGLMLAGAGSIALFVWNGLRPAPDGEPVQFEIPSGSSPFKVAEILEKQGIIRNAFIFKYYLRYEGEGSRFQAGTYEMAPGTSLQAVIKQLNNGDTVKPPTFRFTIPEGFTVLQIADKLSAEGLVDREKFLRLAEQPELFDQSGAIKHIPVNNGQLRHKLEGYLFPETYELVKESGEQDILQRMLHELDRKLDNLPDDWQEQLDKLGISFHDMMTIASLIEREVVVDEERKLVAGVIYNRIEDNMRLQIDATVQYMLDKPKERLYEKDLKVESPYNTYQIDGIPPGPIASPSLESIEAALYPEDTPYYYYVTKKDGTYAHLFAESYNEHRKNIEISKRTAKEGAADNG
ncbi:endolytic transglycosylase MltG [Paenibacillus tarimensis]